MIKNNIKLFFVFSLFLLFPLSAFALTDVTGVGTGTLSLSGTGNGSLVFYKGDFGMTPVYGDRNCNLSDNCSWSSTASSGFGYGTGDPYFYFVDGINGNACSSLSYENCLLESGATDVGCYVTDGSTWSACEVPSDFATSSTMNGDAPFGFALILLILSFMATAVVFASMPKL